MCRSQVQTSLVTASARNRNLLRYLRRAPTLVHNHPSGDPTPSGADVKMTRELVDIGKPLGIAIHDHVVVGRDGHASFKGLGLI